MQKNPPIPFLVLVSFISLAIGIASNVAASQFPEWLQPHLWLSWPILIISSVLAIVLTIYDAKYIQREQNPPSVIVNNVISTPPKEELKPLPATTPIPPAPYFVHSYGLQPNFKGRAHERDLLTDWFANQSQSVFVLEAIGGMGKSALAWVWTKEILRANRIDTQPEGTFWWSFYDPEGRDLTQFLDKALSYFSQGALSGKSFASDRDRIDGLLTQLQKRHFLLVLDGLERILRGYARMDAAYLGDEIDPNKRSEFRACADPNAGLLLRNLTTNAGLTKTLITTRIMPRELNDLEGVQHLELKGLDAKDAVDFFVAQKIRGTRAEIETVCSEYGFHPLSLRLLSGTLAQDPQYHSDIKYAPRVNPLEQDKERKMLDFAYNSLSTRRQKLISQIAAFRSPLSWESLAAIFLTPPQQENRIAWLLARADFKNKNELANAVTDLIQRGLLQHDDATDTYDLHPVIRRYCYDHLANKAQTHAVLVIYFQKVEAPPKIQSLADLQPVIELYHHIVNAGRYDEAQSLFKSRLDTPTYYQFGAYQLQIELLRGLFPDGEDKLPRLKSESEQARTLNDLALVYALWGQPRHAVPLFERFIAIREKEGNKNGVAIGLGNVALMAQIHLGELKAAEQNHRHRIEICREIKDEFSEAIGHQELGRVLAYRGEFAEAERELATSTAYWEKTNDVQGLSLDSAYRTLRALLMGDTSAALEHARKAREFAEEWARTQYPYERDFVRAEWLIGAALVAGLNLTPAPFLTRRGETFLDAERHLTEALMRCRRINLVESEAGILLEWAKLRFVQAREQTADNGQQTTNIVVGRRSSAVALMDESFNFAIEALQIAERCEYRLDQAEIHNFLAEWHLQMAEWSQGEVGKIARATLKQKAKEHAEKAKERAECDGPPYYYKVAYEKAEKMLKGLRDED